MSSAFYANTKPFRSFLPEPAVWAKAVQNAGLYPELTYSAYRIRKGDMISVIAENFGVTQDTLISINNIRQTRRIQIGEYLRIPSMPGILYTTKKPGETPGSIAEKYQVSAKKTAAVNHLNEQSALEAGVTVFVPDAFLDWVTRQEINGDLFRRPLRGRYYLSSVFGWRNSPFTGKRSFHNGVDMAAATWTPVYAALVGKVTTVGYNSVYGNYVIVAHHSGYRTLYGHLAGVKARKGQHVDTKSVIGWVGNTGLSTGPHLHFSVFKYGSAVNPMGLWN
ncbi:M23 family metallopeptidase [Treponema sp. OMZ 840]